MQAPLWDDAARGPGAYPNNTAFVHEFTTNLLTTSFPNMRPQQVQVTSVAVSSPTLTRAPTPDCIHPAPDPGHTVAYPLPLHA